MTPEQLKERRIKAGLSQARLARLLRVSRQTLYKWEVGQHPIPGVAQVAIEHVLLLRGYPPE